MFLEREGFNKINKEIPISKDNYFKSFFYKTTLKYEYFFVYFGLLSKHIIFLQ